MIWKKNEEGTDEDFRSSSSSDKGRKSENLRRGKARTTNEQKKKKNNSNRAIHKRSDVFVSPALVTLFLPCARARFFPDVSHQVIQTYDDTSTWIIERQRRQVAAGSLNGFGRVLFSVSPLFRRQLHLGLCGGSTDYGKKEEQKRKSNNDEKYISLCSFARVLVWSFTQR